MRRVLTGTELTYLETLPHKKKVYLVVDIPTAVFTARVNSAAIAYPNMTIPYDGGVGDHTAALAGMTLILGSSAGARDLGKVRVKTAPDGAVAGDIVVAENSDVEWADNMYITVLDVFEAWSVFPRIKQTAGDNFYWYKDWDIQCWHYLGGEDKNNVWLPPTSIMGPDAVAFLDGATVTLDYIGEDSFTLCSNGIKHNFVAYGDVSVSAICAWAFQAGTPNTAVSLGTRAVPIEVSYATAGRYIHSLQVANDLPLGHEKTHTGYRTTHILNRPGTASGVNEPYDEVEIREETADFNAGGSTATVRVWGDADINEFPDGSKIILFSENWYGGTLVSGIGGYPGRENIDMVGWIMNETIRADFDPIKGKSYVEFRVQTIDGVMKEIEAFPQCVVDRSSQASGWPAATSFYEMFKLQINRAALYQAYWHSTTMNIVDFNILIDNSRMAIQNFPSGSLYRQLDDYCAGAFLGRLLSDRQSCLWLEKNIQLCPDGWRTQPTVIALDTTKHIHGELNLKREHRKKVRFVELSGVGWTGTAATPFIAKAPGTAPNQEGVDKTISGLVLESQAEANQIAGYALANENNPWPRVPLKFQGNHGYLDIAPQNWVTLSLGVQATKRGVVWTDKKLVPRSVTRRYKPETLSMEVEATFEAEATGDAGVTGDYTPVAEIPVVPPPSPVLPVGWNGIAYVGTDDGLYRIVTKSTEWELATSREAPFSLTDELCVNNIELDATKLGLGNLPLIIATDQGLFHGDTSGTEIVWTRYDIDDPPNTWGTSPAPTEKDLEYTHIRIDEHDGFGNTFWFIGWIGTLGSSASRQAWLGCTKSGGIVWHWYPLRDATYDAQPPQPESLDIDKEDGSRIFVTGHYYLAPPTPEGCGLFIFNASDGSLSKALIQNRELLYGTSLQVFCPYLPEGTGADGDYFILYGHSVKWDDGVDNHYDLIFTTDLGVTFTELADYSGLDLTGEAWFSFVDVVPGNEAEFCSLFSPDYDSGGPPHHYFIESDEVPWYSGVPAMEPLEIPEYRKSRSAYSTGFRHKRNADQIIMHGGERTEFFCYSPSYSRVMLSLNKGISWYNITRNLRDDVETRCCVLDWGSIP